MLAALSSLLAQADTWTSPAIDWHAIAPELIVSSASTWCC
jgi:hypothetical protein